jgi:hypothetical protein
MSDISWNSLTPRADEFWLRGITDTPLVTSQGFNFYGNTSSAFINELKFAAAKSVRTSIIVLASFNVLAAVGVIFGVLFDSAVVAKRDDPKFRLRFGYPLSLKTVPLLNTVFVDHGVFGSSGRRRSILSCCH